MNNDNIEVQKKQSDPDEINLLEYFYVLVKNKWLIIVLTILGLVGGYVTALILGPKYVSDAVIAPRESESIKTPDVSGLGMFGGMVMSQLKIGGNASLDKIELILDSRSFNAELVEKKELLPLAYPEFWDSANNKWVGGFEVPKFVSVGGYIKGEFLDKEINKNGTMTISIENEDSLFSYKLQVYRSYTMLFVRKVISSLTSLCLLNGCLCALLTICFIPLSLCLLSSLLPSSECILSEPTDFGS